MGRRSVTLEGGVPFPVWNTSPNPFTTVPDFLEASFTPSTQVPTQMPSWIGKRNHLNYVSAFSHRFANAPQRCQERLEVEREVFSAAIAERVVCGAVTVLAVGNPEGCGAFPPPIYLPPVVKDMDARIRRAGNYQVNFLSRSSEDWSGVDLAALHSIRVGDLDSGPYCRRT